MGKFFVGVLTHGQILTEVSSVFNFNSPAMCVCLGISLNWENAEHWLFQEVEFGYFLNFHLHEIHFID